MKDLDELDKAHKALKSEYSLLSKSYEQLQIRLAKYDVPSSSTSTCDHANIVEENARLKDELAKASSPQSKLSLDDLLSKQRSNNGKEGLGYNAKANKANKKKAKPAQEKKKVVINGDAPKAKPLMMMMRELLTLTMFYLKIIMVMFMQNMLVPMMVILLGLFGSQRPLLLTKEDPLKNGYLNPRIDLM